MLILMLLNILINISFNVSLMEGEIVQAFQRPELSIKESEVIISSNENLTVTCMGNEPLQWTYFPNNYVIKDITWSKIEAIAKEPNETFPHLSILTIQNASFTDTRFYYCHYQSEDFGKRDYGKGDYGKGDYGKGDFGKKEYELAQKSRKFYLYVNDPQHLSVIYDDVPVYLTANQTGYLPCRPTSPHLHVTLDPNQSIFSFGSVDSYDKRFGFVVNAAVSETDTFETVSCIFLDKNGGHKNFTLEMDVYLANLAEITPKIVDLNQGHTTVGGSLMLDCSVEKTRERPIFMGWVRPRPKPLIHFDAPDGTQSGLSKTFVKYDVVDEDVGEYTCLVLIQNQVVSKSIEVDRIFETNETFIRFLNQTNLTESVSVGSAEVSWSIFVEVHPFATFSWFKDGRKLVHLSKKYRLTRSQNLTVTRHTIELFNLTFEDSGHYTLVANQEDYHESCSLFLEVLGKPFVEIFSKRYFMLKEYVEFHVEIIGYPMENIENVSLILEYPSLGETHCLSRFSYTRVSDVISLYGYNFTVKDNGMLRCEAENEQGIGVGVFEFKVTDVKDGFDVWSSSKGLGYESDEGGGYIFGGSTLEEPILGGSTLEGPILGGPILEGPILEGPVTQEGPETQGPETAIIPEAEGEATLAEGESLSIHCGVSLDRISTIRWYKKDKQIYNTKRQSIEYNNTTYSHRSTLTVSNVTKEDGGELTCRTSFEDPISHEKIVLTKDFSLQIIESIRPSLESNTLNGQEENVNVSGQFKLDCSARGRPKPHVEWYKNGRKLSPIKERLLLQTFSDNHFLEFLRTEPDDEGTYECRATSNAGVTSRFVTLIVHNDSDGSMPFKIFLLASLLIIIIILLATYYLTNLKRKKERAKLSRLLNREKGNRKSYRPESLIDPEIPVNEQTELLAYTADWEFPPSKLKIGNQFEYGYFSVSYQATAVGIARHRILGIPGEEKTTVAVKMAKPNEGSSMKAMVSELKILSHLGKHPNIVNLLGACTQNVKKRKLRLIVEYCRFGNVHNYLLRRRDEFMNQIDLKTDKVRLEDRNPVFLNLKEALRSLHGLCPKDDSCRKNGLISGGLISDGLRPKGGLSPRDSLYRRNAEDDSDPKPIYTEVRFSKSEECLSSKACRAVSCDEGVMYAEIQPTSKSQNCLLGNQLPKNYVCTKDLLLWSLQIARGMEYVASKNVIHGNLLARNIYLTDDNVVKIGNFGWTKPKKSPWPKAVGNLPIKWMPMEAIRDNLFSTKSDVWSYGVVLWEMFTLARTPYSVDKTNEAFLLKLEEGNRLECPEYATKEIYQIMLDCWKTDPLSRPSFKQLMDRFGKILGQENLEAHTYVNDINFGRNSSTFANTRVYVNDFVLPEDVEDDDKVEDEIGSASGKYKEKNKEKNMEKDKEKNKGQNKETNKEKNKEKYQEKDKRKSLQKNTNEDIGETIPLMRLKKDSPSPDVIDV